MAKELITIMSLITRLAALELVKVMDVLINSERIPMYSGPVQLMVLVTDGLKCHVDL